MKKYLFKSIVLIIVVGFVFNLAGCAALKAKFTRKKKAQKTPVYYQVKKYDIKPSMELYEKHYIFWLNWHKKLLQELGYNFKSDIRCLQDVSGNLEDMQGMLVDEKAAEFQPHIDDINKVRAIIDKRSMTTSNETRIRLILEREYRMIKRSFSPKEMAGFIRKDWKVDENPGVTE